MLGTKARLPRAYQASADHPEREEMLRTLPVLLMDPNFLSLVSCVEEELDRLCGAVANAM